jgi:dCTP deaminase
MEIPMLSDRTIQRLMAKEQLVISVPDGDRPIRPDQFQPVSVDLRLGAVLHPRRVLARTDLLKACGPYYLEPQQFMLGSTIEHVELCANIVGKVEGKSTRAREGLIVEAAGLVDPGFRGQLTLELYNMSNVAVVLDYGMKICQMYLHWVDTTPQRVYGSPGLNSHYQDQTGPTPARF